MSDSKTVSPVTESVSLRPIVDERWRPYTIVRFVAILAALLFFLGALNGFPYFYFGEQANIGFWAWIIRTMILGAAYFLGEMAIELPGELGKKDRKWYTPLLQLLVIVFAGGASIGLVLVVYYQFGN